MVRRESARGQQHFLLSVMGSVNRPNLGICTSADDDEQEEDGKKEADEVGNKTATGIRSGRRPRGRKALLLLPPRCEVEMLNPTTRSEIDL